MYPYADKATQMTVALIRPNRTSRHNAQYSPDTDKLPLQIAL